MNYLGILSNHLKKNKDRARSFHILRAAMSGAGLVATADGVACNRETRKTKELISSLDALKLYDAGLGIRLFNETVSMLNRNQKKGTETAMSDISKVKDDPESAAMVVMFCKAVSEADGHLDGAEKASIDRIQKDLGVSDEDVRRYARDNDTRPKAPEDE
jgi:tellurite resistance protein